MSRDPFVIRLGLLTTVFHRFYGARRVLYVVETTFQAEFESHSLRHVIDNK